MQTARGVAAISQMDRPARGKLTLKPSSIRLRSSRQDPFHFGAGSWHGVWLPASCKLLLKTFCGMIRGLHMIQSLV
jgi:hypothetical protein